MSREREAPGAALVALRRLDTLTEVMLLPSPGAGAALPTAAPKAGTSQWMLAEELLRETGLARVERLYASPLAIEADGSAALGVFVAFVGTAGEAEAAAGHWMDLREASAGLGPGWSDVLAAVRERFVARPPDEALRLR